MIVEPLELLDSADIALAQARISELLAAGARSLLLLAGEDTGFDLPAWDELLQRQAVPVFGGIFPRIVFGGRDLARGLLIVGLSCTAEVCVVEGLDDESPSFARYHGHCAMLREAGTVLLWVDALARHIDVLTEAAYDMLGAGPVYMGGGAGSLSLRPQPCLFSNRGVLQGAALLVGLPLRLSVGVQHGWEPVAGPFLVSTVRGNEIRSLDFRPALQVYRSEIERLAGLQVTDENFLAVVRSFPLGVERMDGSFLVREPVRLEGERLVCIGDVPAQSALHILHADSDALLQAAGRACAEALQKAGGRMSGMLLVDCISRGLFLDHAYAGQLQQLSAALEANGQTNVPVFGVLSLGEIANPGGACLEFHNKTFVLGVLPDACA